jgi:hypothetical protein
MTFAALAGGAAALAGAIALLSSGGRHTADSGRESTLSRRPATVSAARPRAAYAGRSTAAAESVPAAPAPRPAADGATVEKARDLLRRLQAAVGPRLDFPDDLQRDLLAFLAASEENRAALFTLAWDPAIPRTVVGHLKIFLMNLPDAESRRVLLASFDAFDPNAAALADGAARAKDPALFVASLRAAASGKERLELMKKIPQSALAEPHMAAWLLEAARSDQDEAVRGTAYAQLAFSGSKDVLPLIASVAGDAGRSEFERKSAAFALAIHPEKPSVEDLLRLYETGSEDVRRNLLLAFASAPSSRRVDDLLVEVLTDAGTSEKTRRSAASAVGQRLPRLPAEEARALGARTAEAVRSLGADDAVTVLTNLGGSVVKNQPLREAIQDLRRTAPEGGAIQLAIASVPSLRFVVSMN